MNRTTQMTKILILIYQKKLHFFQSREITQRGFEIVHT